MISILREDWIKNPQFKHWGSKNCTSTKCNCSTPDLVELWEQDSCVRGRIDTIICQICDKVNSFKIIR